MFLVEMTPVTVVHTEKKPLFTQFVTLVIVEWAFSLTTFQQMNILSNHQKVTIMSFSRLVI